jgi:hypothetical protein
MKLSKTLLDTAFEEKQAAINKNFLKEWKPYPELSKMVEQAIFNHFRKKVYQWQPTHDETDKKDFRPVTYHQINMTLGFAYTSSSDYAGYWVCNGGYLFADPTHHFIGFAINTDNKVIGIAWDENENEIFIEL